MNIEEKAIEVLKHCKDRNFSAFDKIYFDDGTNMCIYQAIETLLTAYEKEKEKNKELEEKIIHRYKRICPECNNSFIAKRNNTKYCQKCSKKVARRKYKEANKEKIREYSKLHMRKYRAKKKLLKEE